MASKFVRLYLMVLFCLSSLIVSCGGGGGGGGDGVGVNSGVGNTMTVTITTENGGGAGVGTVTYTEGFINGYGYYDPDMEADIYPDTGRMIIMLSSGVVGGSPPDLTINIVTQGHTAGAYPIDGTSAMQGMYTYITYKDGSEYHDGVVSSGTVTIDSIGNVGDPVIGSFSAVVLCSSPTHTHGFSGTFNMKRAH